MLQVSFPTISVYWSPASIRGGKNLGRERILGTFRVSVAVYFNAIFSILHNYTGNYSDFGQPYLISLQFRGKGKGKAIPVQTRCGPEGG